MPPPVPRVPRRPSPSSSVTGAGKVERGGVGVSRRLPVLARGVGLALLMGSARALAVEAAAEPARPEALAQATTSSAGKGDIFSDLTAPAVETVPSAPARKPAELAQATSPEALKGDEFSDFGAPAVEAVPSVSSEKPAEGASSAKTFTLGGSYLQRLEMAARRAPDDQLSLQAAPPAIVDIFLNIQPTPEMRGYVLSRLTFDPTALGRTAPQWLLDQLWFRWTPDNHVFVAVGRQQVRWGSGSVWNPTDFLRKLNPTPLEFFDLRTGTDMVRVHVPVNLANFYGIAFLDQQGPVTDAMRYGGALRAEVAMTSGELAASAVFLQGRKPRYGLDANFGLGPFDVYGELALLQDSGRTPWRRTELGTFVRAPSELGLQATVGAHSRVRIADVYQLAFRVEGFFNSLGYTDRRYLTWLIANGDYLPLYFGREYAMVQLVLTKRSPFEPSLALTGLANFRDNSYLTRLSANIATTLGVAFGAFVEVPWGDEGSEFRFVPDPTVSTDVPNTGLNQFRAGIWGRMQY